MLTSFLHTLGYARRICARIHDLAVPEDRRLDDEAFEKLMAFGVCAPFEKNLMRRDGSSFRCCSAPRFTTKRLRASSSTSRRTSRRRALNHLAYHDALTGSAEPGALQRSSNRRSRWRRNDQMQAVLLLNLDRFKTSTITGRQQRRRSPQSVAQRLTSCVRESDTVARFGGDEFAVLLTHHARRTPRMPRARSRRHSIRRFCLTIRRCLLRAVSASPFIRRTARYGEPVEERRRRCGPRESAGR